MRVLVLHSDIAPDAPLDDQDTLMQAAAIEKVLIELGHEASRAPFVPDPASLDRLIARECPDVVFNLIETVWGRGLHAPVGATMLAALGVPFTGAPASAMAATGDKLLTKRLLSGAELPTANWAEAPAWAGVEEDVRFIVKSVDEDASLGLDDGAVVRGRDAIVARAQACAARHGGRWFAERYIEGREFNVAVLEKDGEPYVLPIGEMLFERWEKDRPRIVGYAAKWEEAAFEYNHTPRVFDWHERTSGLRKTLDRLTKDCWSLFGLKGYARVDFRVDAENRPYILEVNPNPCVEPNAGFAAAALQAGMSYADIIDTIVRAALRG